MALKALNAQNENIFFVSFFPEPKIYLTNLNTSSSTINFFREYNPFPVKSTMLKLSCFYVKTEHQAKPFNSFTLTN